MRQTPFTLEHRPAVINFSGGRTSAYMTYRILEDCGGRLPPDTVVVFANTGKEDDLTLEFVRECGERWLLPIIWVEYLLRPDAAGGRKEPKHYFRRVNFETASRNSEPFDMLIEAKKMLPTVANRTCSDSLKVKPAKMFVQRMVGWRSLGCGTSA